MTAEMAKKVVELLGIGNNLLHHRTVVICLLGFSGFLRISELIEIQVRHLSFLDSHLEITIPKAKNDQMREGHIVHIARTHTEHCPVYWLRKYLQDTGLQCDENNYVVSRLAKTRTGHNAHGHRPLCDTSGTSLTEMSHPFVRISSPGRTVYTRFDQGALLRQSTAALVSDS